MSLRNGNRFVSDGYASLFAYRQVTHQRSMCQSGRMYTVYGVFYTRGSILHLLDFNILPDDPALALFYFFVLWLLGLGLGMIFCVMVATFRESEQFVSISMLPMLIISGAIIPVQVFPHAVQQWLWWNPVLHGVELTRLAF